MRGKPTAWRMMLQEIIHGLKMGLDVSAYAKPEFDYDQMVQIRFGLQRGLDVSTYAKPEYPSSTMMTLRHAMELGIDVSKFDNRYQTLIKYQKQFTIENELKAIRRRYSDIKHIDKYNRDQLFAIDHSIFFYGATIEMVNNYINLNMDGETITDILFQLTLTPDVIKYVSPDMDYEHIGMIAHALNNGAKVEDFKPYLDMYDEYEKQGILKPYVDDEFDEEECDGDCENCLDPCEDFDEDFENGENSTIPEKDNKKSSYNKEDALRIAMNLLKGKNN